MNDILVIIINVVCNILIIAIVLRAILSLLGLTASPLNYFLREATEPLLSPIRKLLPSTGMFDFSPILLIFLLDFARAILVSILISI